MANASPVIMSEEGRFVYSRDGTKIWAEARGCKGKPGVVFIHDFNASAMVFDTQFRDQKLLENLYLVRFDLRGHGRSDRPSIANKDPYSSVCSAEDFMAVCEAFSLDKPFLAGWGLGGTIVGDISAHYGSNIISGCILLGGIPFCRLQSQVENSAIDIHEILQNIRSGCVDWLLEAVDKYISSWVADGFKIPYEDRMQWFGAVVAQGPGPLPNSDLVDKHRWTYRAQDLRNLYAVKDRFPFLVIQGDKDVHIDWKKVKPAMKAFSVVEYRLQKGVGHAPFYEQASLVQKEILAFAKQVMATQDGKARNAKAQDVAAQDAAAQITAAPDTTIQGTEAQNAKARHAARRPCLIV